MPQVPAIALQGFDPYADTAILYGPDTGILYMAEVDQYDTGWGLGSITRGISRAVKGAARSVAKVAKSVAKSPVIQSAVNAAQQGLAATGPWGMAAAGALGGMSALVRGKNLREIGLAAAEGASPPGIRQAVQAAGRIARGDPPVAAAISGALGALSPEGQQAAKLAISALKTGRGVAALASARRSLPSEAQRRAFDLAVGAVSKAARINPEVSRRSGARSSSRAGRAAARAARAQADARKRVQQQQIARRAMSRSASRAGAAAAAAARKMAEARRRLHGLGRPGAVRDPIAEAAARGRRRVVVHRQPIDAQLRSNPSLLALRPSDLARRLHVTPTEAVAALGRRTVAMRPQALSSRALRFLASYAPAVPLGLFRRDTTGFERSGSEWIYVVEKDDYPYKLASKYAPGGAARAGTTYRQLLKANPQYTLNKDKSNFKQFYTGMRLKWPEGWTVPATAEPAPEPAAGPPETGPVPTATVPSAAPALTSIVQAKALLATWGVTDGAGEPGINGYGATTEDLTPTWTGRDKLQLMAFSRWSNSTRGTSLDTDGALDPAHLQELKRWAERRAALPSVVTQPTRPSTPAAMPPEVPALPAPSVPTEPTQTLPEMVITGSPPPVIGMPPVQIPEGAPPPPVIGMPPIQPAPRATPAPTRTAAAKKKPSGALPLIAVAAAFATGVI